MLALIYNPALPNIVFWSVAVLIGINAGLGIVVLYWYGEKWWKGN